VGCMAFEGAASRAGPLGNVGKGALAAPGQASFPGPSQLHVLLVDDERLSRTIVASMLRKCNYEGKRVARRGCGRPPCLPPHALAGGPPCAGWHSLHPPAALAVTTAESGAEAMELLRKSPHGTFQLVLTVGGHVQLS
jgi:CheY-like chemotaxis protein